VRLSVAADGKTQKQNAPKHITAALGENFEARLGSPPLRIFAQLLDSGGAANGRAPRVAVVDRAGKVDFDFNEDLKDASEGRYLLHVVSPSAVVCDDRITVQA
jgi:hypothetical protein